MMPIQKPGRSKQDYGTPVELICAIQRVWGPFAIDLAAHDDGSNAKAPEWIGPTEDSLRVDWYSRLAGRLGWLNPEFADIDPWVEKCNLESRRGARIITLTPASIGAEWFATHCEGIARVIGLRPRLCFQGCHVLFPKEHPLCGQPRCGGDELCDGCATYPKDCMLTLWGAGFEVEPMFRTWRWK